MRKFTDILILLAISFNCVSQRNNISIDTDYLPVQEFQVEFNNKKWIDSIGVYFDIQYLKAFDEPPIYCCRTDSSIRILTVPSFQPATIIELVKKDSRYILRTKESRKVGLDNSYLDPGQLKRKDRKRFYELTNNNSPRSKWSEDDQRIYELATVNDTEEFSYSTQEIEISLNEWNNIFSYLNDQLYELQAKPKKFSAVADGYSLLLEAVTQNGYIVLSRGSGFPPEHNVIELVTKIKNHGK